MNVKIKIQLFLLFIGSTLIIISIFTEGFSLGKFWYNVNSNSLVGFQNVLEKTLLEKSYFHGLCLEACMTILKSNIFFVFGIFLSILSFFLSLFKS